MNFEVESTNYQSNNYSDDSVKQQLSDTQKESELKTFEEELEEPTINNENLNQDSNEAADSETENKESNIEAPQKEEGSDSTKTHSKGDKDEEPVKRDDRNLIKIYEDSSMRKQLSYAIYQLRERQTITLQAFGENISRAVKMAEILKMRLGMLHQENMLLVKFQQRSQPREDMSGILIKLSKLSLDPKHLGYQKPMPREDLFNERRGNENEFRGSQRNRLRLNQNFPRKARSPENSSNPRPFNAPPGGQMRGQPRFHDDFNNDFRRNGNGRGPNRIIPNARFDHQPNEFSGSMLASQHLRRPNQINNQQPPDLNEFRGNHEKFQGQRLWPWNEKDELSSET
uniref:Macronuclear development protein 2 n=1 Tax=Stylonychia lemnae TaxID=5949 RepID=Q8ISG7_STYLE|nr:macronuclear development protein 2 [Stylonychia lemnae]AAP20880.1 macronuclear development protein 2 [Stylonychia lemnae]